MPQPEKTNIYVTYFCVIFAVKMNCKLQYILLIIGIGFKQLIKQIEQIKY